MEKTRDRTPAPDAAGRRFGEVPADGEAEARPDATLEIEGQLKVAADEETGGDPYNHTGRFKRSIR